MVSVSIMAIGKSYVAYVAFMIIVGVDALADISTAYVARVVVGVVTIAEICSADITFVITCFVCAFTAHLST